MTQVDFERLTRRAEQAIERCDDTLRTTLRLLQRSRDLRGTVTVSVTVSDAEAEAGADIDTDIDSYDGVDVDAVPPWPSFFVVHGMLDGERVRASWFRGGLLATAALQERADLLVRMGETFQMDQDGPVVDAGLESSLAAMLTVIRSCDRLVDASFGPLGAARRVLRYTTEPSSRPADVELEPGAA